MEIKKLNEVTLVESVGDEANVLIEENAEIKRVPKTAIGAQADWDETDETSPAFIMNKPESLGGYTYYSYYNNKLHKSDGTYSLETEEPTRAEFESEYRKNPIMILYNGGIIEAGLIAPLISYKISSGYGWFGVHNGVSIVTYQICFPS